MTASTIGTQDSRIDTVDLPLRLGLAAALLAADVVLIAVAVRRNGWRGSSTSMGERVLIYLPIGLCLFVAGLLLLGAG